MKVRFLINTKTKGIVYIEAGKWFVDELLCILTMPTGYIAKFLLQSQSAKKVGSLTNLYQSRENLPLPRKIYKNPWKFVDSNHNIFDDDSRALGVGNCGVCPLAGQNSETTHNICGIDGGYKCSCGHSMNKYVELKRGKSYVECKATFLITDDLKITASSIPNSRRILNQLNIGDIAELEERTVNADREKACKLVEASLVSRTVLNDVFGPELFEDLSSDA